MPATAIIFRITDLAAPNNYGYQWKDDSNQDDWDTVVAGVTKAAAFTAVATKFNNLPGDLQRVELVGG